MSDISQPTQSSSIVESSKIEDDKKKKEFSVHVKKGPFKIQNSLEKRKIDAERILSKYPDRIPVIVENADKSTIPELDKNKYLVPGDLSMGQFMYVIRKRIKLESDQAIFIFVNNTLAPAGTLLSQVYKEHKDEDGFVYFKVSGESTFGNI